MSKTMAQGAGDGHVVATSPRHFNTDGSASDNPTYSSSIPQFVSSSNYENGLGFMLPENYTDADMGNLLNRVMDSPELLSKDTIVTVFNATDLAPTPTLDSPDSDSEPNAMKDLGEYSTEVALGNVGGSNTEEPGEARRINSAIMAYGKAQEKQIQRLMELVTPLSHEIGTKRNEICYSCFHAGHSRTDYDICPAAHIKSLLSGESYYDRFSEKEEARLCLVGDIGLACQGLAWGIKHVNQGYMQELGMSSVNITQLHALLKQWHLASKDEKFTFGKFKECGGEMMFGEPIKISLVENNQSPYKQVFASTAPASKEKRSSNPVDSLISFDPTTIPSAQPTRKEKTECDADRLKLEVIGNRLAAICTNCFHRGHAKSSVKICPYMIISLAIDKAKNSKRKRKLDNIEREVQRLRKVVDGLLPDKRNKVDQIIVLLNEWNNVVANSVNGSSIQTRKRAVSTQDRTQKDKPPAVPEESLIQTTYPNGPPKLSNEFPLMPLQNGGHGSNPFLPSTLNSPFDDKDDSALYDMPLVDNHYSPLQLPQEPGQYPKNSQQEVGRPSRERYYSLPALDIGFDAGELVGQEGMELFLDEEFDTTVSNNRQPFPENRPHTLDLNSTGGKPFTLPHQSQQVLASPPNTPMSRSSSPSSLISQNDAEIVDMMIESSSEDVSTKYELPSEIYWRSRCPLTIIGNRNDRFCKACLHYGHNKRSHASCLVNVVMSAIATGEPRTVLRAAGSITDMESAAKWQNTLPKDMQSDTSTIKKVVRRWKKVSESLKNEVDGYANMFMDIPDPEPAMLYSYIEAEQQQGIQEQEAPHHGANIDTRNAKRPRLSEKQYPSVPACQKQQAQHKAVPQRNIQTDPEIEHFALDVRRASEGKFTQVHQLKSPFVTPPGQQKSRELRRQSQKYTLGFTPETLYSQAVYPQKSEPQQSYLQQSFPQQSFPQQPFPQQSFPQQFFPQQSFPQQAPTQLPLPQQQAATAPKGVAIDYTKMPPDLFAKVSEYILDDENCGDQLRINFQGMPPMLVVAIRKYILPIAPTSQPTMHQQPYIQSNAPPPSHLSSVSHQYNNQSQNHAYTPKRKRT